MTAFAPKIEAARAEGRARLIDALLATVACHRVGGRPACLRSCPGVGGCTRSAMLGRLFVPHGFTTFVGRPFRKLTTLLMVVASSR